MTVGKMNPKHFFPILACVICSLSCQSPTEGPCVSKRIFHLGETRADLPFSPAIQINQTLYISGQLAINSETGKFEGDTMAAQAERCILNIEHLLKKAGFDLSHVVQTTVYITDFKEFGEFNRIFKKHFPNDPPTRATVQVVKLAMDAKIEISAIAVK